MNPTKDPQKTVVIACPRRRDHGRQPRCSPVRPRPSRSTRRQIQAANRYWACVAVDHRHIGACLENPLPRLGG